MGQLVVNLSLIFVYTVLVYITTDVAQASTELVGFGPETGKWLLALSIFSAAGLFIGRIMQTFNLVKEVANAALNMVPAKPAPQYQPAAGQRKMAVLSFDQATRSTRKSRNMV